MTGGNPTLSGGSTEVSGPGGPRKGHRRQETMYAMTGLYSESVPEEGDTTKPATTTFSDTVVRCHSRNPSSGFDRYINMS